MLLSTSVIIHARSGSSASITKVHDSHLCVCVLVPVPVLVLVLVLVLGFCLGFGLVFGFGFDAGLILLLVIEDLWTGLGESRARDEVPGLHRRRVLRVTQSYR